MATYEEVYAAFGKTAELAQLLETELGTLLVALEGLRAGAYRPEPWEDGARVCAAIDKNTLGASLRQAKAQLKFEEDTDALFADALVARNHLSHNFFREHGLDIATPWGRDEMLLHLDLLRADLWHPYEVAGEMARRLVAIATELRDTNDPDYSGSNGESAKA